MKRLALTLLACAALLRGATTAQDSRSMPDSTLAPFYHGVASGDPLTDRVILWTRLTLEEPVSEATLSWRIATDTLFQNVVQSGTVTTNAERDYTVKVDATGLQPNTWYYYQFEYKGVRSLIGRTRTLPQGNLERLRLAVVSCSDYQSGYFHAYRDLALRNSVDAVLHLGDYIYEYPAASILLHRNHQPSHEIITLQDYRLRHSLYKLDKDLRLLHQQLPMIAVWDDHETANNSWTHGAQNHQPDTEGPWESRKHAGKQAYMEWMPIRENATADNEIYRKFIFGNLVSLYMLDTRLEGRSQQVPNTSPELNDTSRTLISPQQFNWLTAHIRRDTARWILLGQQVMMAPLQAFGQVLNTDQWDGYPVQRQRLYDSLLHYQKNNLVVLTGDLHTAWANDLPLSNYNPTTGENAIGVEFITTSITSSKIPVPGGPSIVQLLNPHVKFVDLVRFGYFILDVTAQRAQAEFVFINDVKSTTYSVELGPAWATLHGSRRLSPSTLSNPPLYPPLAPLGTGNVSYRRLKNSLINLVAIPNPFVSQVVLQFALLQPEQITIEISDMHGHTWRQHTLGRLPEGLHHVHFDATGWPPGQYLATLRTSSGHTSARLVHIRMP
ncbi:MAG: alkaline phosphatase D family protein [Saprospiraceae bacterium]|nr:alkaline phosphatase D family protein [Saprospiraceae bacterium]MDW8484200.1 alkaline phosphatase D family protein [Saprospiraceae bacterium]